MLDGGLFGIVAGRIGAVAGVKTFLVHTETALCFAIMMWCVGADQLMAGSQFPSSFLKKGLTGSGWS